MKVIIVGCGRLGCGLAQDLDQTGVDVTVIDTDPEQLKTLGSDFSGKTVVGVGFDQHVLENAGIKTSDAVVASTSSDEVNALIGRISRNIYRVPKVIARLYDRHKAYIYSALGVQTLSATEWGIQRAEEILTSSELDVILSLGNSSVEVVKVEVPPLLAGRPVHEITEVGQIRVIAITRQNEAFLPTQGALLEKDDILYIAATTNSLERLKNAFGQK